MICAFHSLGKRFDVVLCEIDTKTRTVIGYQITLFRNRHSWCLLGNFVQWNPGRRANETLSPRNVGHRETGVLAVRAIHSSMRNHHDSGGLGDVTDFDRGSQAADPLDVRLKIVDDPVADGFKARE